MASFGIALHFAIFVPAILIAALVRRRDKNGEISSKHGNTSRCHRG